MTSSTEQILEDTPDSTAAEGFTENIERIVEAAPASTGPGPGIECGEPELIIGGFFFRIAQGFVGFANLLEFLL